jgi:hypothetical protein
MPSSDKHYCAGCGVEVGSHDPSGVVMGTSIETGETVTLKVCWSCWPPDDALRRWSEGRKKEPEETK